MQEFHVSERRVLEKMTLCAGSLLWRNRIITTETYNKNRMCHIEQLKAQAVNMLLKKII